VIRMVAPSVHNTKENQPGSALCHSKIPCCTLANSFSRKELNLYTVRMEKNCIHYSYVCVPFPGPTGYQQLTPKMHLLCVLAFAKSLVFAKIFATHIGEIIKFELLSVYLVYKSYVWCFVKVFFRESFRFLQKVFVFTKCFRFRKKSLFNFHKLFEHLS
jgi:hypothetical protein